MLTHVTKMRATFELKNFKRKAHREVKSHSEFCFKLMNKVTCPLLTDNMAKGPEKKNDVAELQHQEHLS